MKISLKWLKDYIDFELSPEELADRLTMTGLEVEDVQYVRKGIESVTVARITGMAPHPDADKLSLCEVTDGENSYHIVCGASNMKAGDKVALAPIGTELPPGPKFPEGLKIKKAKIRGQVSEGMLCAENELGLGEESDGIMILPEFAREGGRLIDELGLNDVVMEIAITPNRPDCLSFVGVAREIAANTGSEVKYPEIQLQEDGTSVNELASVKVHDSVRCPRYSCRVITGLRVGPSPKWLKTKLEACGIRSINNVVDVTNFVLLELGQPLHAFDYDLLEGRKIVVRTAEDGERITTLDGVERTLAAEDLLICDGQKPVALAGVMGGADTEVSERTVSILLESAYFSPDAVRKTSRRTGLGSESSYRFERGVDPNGVVYALDRAAALIRKLAGGELAAGAIDVYPEKIEHATVSLSRKRLTSIIGIDIKSEDILSITKGLGFETVSSSDNVFSFSVPTYRFDITREIDLIEEIARLYGYDKVPVTLPSAIMKTDTKSTSVYVREKFRDIMISNGFFEAINYSFEDEKLLKNFNDSSTLDILNPLTSDASSMRTSLLPGLVKNAVMNLNHQATEVRLFEIGNVYIPRESGQLPLEILKFASVAAGRKLPEIWSQSDFDYFDLKNILEIVFSSLSLNRLSYTSKFDARYLHPGKSAAIKSAGKTLGVIGELHPALADRLEASRQLIVCEIDLREVLSVTGDRSRKFSPLPKYPSVRRDISLIVDEKVTAASLLDEIADMGIKLIEDAVVFDVFSGGSLEPGKKSMAVSLQLRAENKTLTDEEINKVQEKALKKLGLSLGAELRTI